MADASAARQRWELENDVQLAEDVDALYKYNAPEQQAMQSQRPWSRDPHHFKQ